MSSLLPRRSGVSLAVAMSTAIFISGCAPSGEDDSSSSSTVSNNTSSESLDIVAGNAIVSKQTLSAADSPSECGTAGGVKLSWGNDTNENNTLDADEIVQSVNVCNGADGVAGQDGTNGTNGTNGTDGQDGANGSDGLSTHHTVVSYTGSECSNGGQEITFGLNDGADNFVVGSTKTFHICNGTNGTGSSTDVTADKIAQGKTLVENTKGYIDALVSKSTYVNYLNDMDGVFADQEAQALYETLAGLIKVSFDALYTNQVTDYETFVSDALSDAESVDTENMIVSDSSGVLSIAGLSVNGVTVNGFSFEYAGHQDDGTDSVDRFEVKSLDMVSGETTLSLASGSDVSFEVRLATGSSSLATLEQYADFDSDEATQSWRDNVTFNVNDNSAATLNLDGVVLGLDSSTNPSSFQGVIGLSFALAESAFEDGFPVLDFGSLMLSGAMTNPFGKSLNIALDVDFASSFTPVDTMDDTADDLEPIAQNFAATLEQGIPVTLSSYTEDWGETIYTATIDYTSLLASLETQLAGYEISGFHTNNEWFKKIIKVSEYCYTTISYYGQNGDLQRTDTDTGGMCMTTDIYSSSAFTNALNLYDSLTIELSNDYLLDFNYSTPYNSAISSSSSVIPVSYTNYGVVKANKNASIDRLVFELSSDVEKEQNFKFEITDLGLDTDYYYNPASYDEFIYLKGTASISLNDDIRAVFPILLDSYPDYIYCAEANSNQDYSGDFEWCIGGALAVGAYKDDIKLHFTDNNGGAFDITFQDRAYDERFNAYVTVDGVNVGKLVQLRDGSYAVEFRDYERVALTDN